MKVRDRLFRRNVKYHPQFCFVNDRRWQEKLLPTSLLLEGWIRCMSIHGFQDLKKKKRSSVKGKAPGELRHRSSCWENNWHLAQRSWLQDNHNSSLEGERALKRKDHFLEQQIQIFAFEFPCTMKKWQERNLKSGSFVSPEQVGGRVAASSPFQGASSQRKVSVSGFSNLDPQGSWPSQATPSPSPCFPNSSSTPTPQPWFYFIFLFTVSENGMEKKKMWSDLPPAPMPSSPKLTKMSSNWQ